MKYSINGHRWAWIGYLIAISIGCICCGILFIRLLFLLFEKWQWLYIKDGEDGSITYLADFLGGMLGILVGFLLDFICVDRLKHIKKYQSLIICLETEVQNIQKLLNENKNIPLEMFENFIFDMENKQTIVNIPRYFAVPKSILKLFKKMPKNKPGAEIYKELALLYNALVDYVEGRNNKDNVDNHIKNFKHIFNIKTNEVGNGY